MARYKGNADAGFFDFAAFSISTMNWSNADVGIYMRLLSICFFNGYVTDRDVRIICRKKFSQLNPIIIDKFLAKDCQKNGKKYVNKKMAQTRLDARKRWRSGGPRVGAGTRFETETETNKKDYVQKDAADVKAKRIEFFKTLHDEITNNAEWWNSFCMTEKVDVTKGEEMIKYFAKHSKGEEYHPTTYRDFKEYFRNVFRQTDIRRKLKTKFYT